MFSRLFAQLNSKAASETPNKEEQAYHVAREKIHALGDDPDQYTVETKRHNTLIKLLFIPRQRNVRGGGYEITIDSKTWQIQNILYYQ